MVKVTLKDGTVVEGTSEEIYALDLFVETDEVVSVEVDEAPLKVGDYVAISGQSYLGVNLDGRLGTYEGLSVARRGLARVSIPDGKEYLIQHKQLRKATEAEVAQAEVDAKQRKRDAVFTANGRKVNEYREGDIVKIAKFQLGDKVGTLHEIKVVSANGVGFPSRYSADFDAIEIVAFAESRLDRK